MIIIIDEIINLQKKLDKVIEDKVVFEETPRQQILKNKLLAFIVELGELANETRCFKYWSQKSASPKNMIAEEYADGLHFLLSIGISLGLVESTIEIISNEETTSINSELVECFTEIINLSTSYFANLTNKDEFQKILKKYFILGIKLNLSINDIFNSYKLKNKINFERQKNNY